MDTDPFHLLSRLCAGFRPGPAELARSAVIEDWLLVPTVGPFLLTGRVSGEDFFAVLIALDGEARWALLTDQWLKLGRGSGSLAPFDEIMRRAALWLAEGGSPSSFETAAEPVIGPAGVRTRWRPPRDEGGSGTGDVDEAHRIAAEATLLAQRAERAGLSAAAFLLDMAAMEADAPQ